MCRDVRHGRAGRLAALVRPDDTLARVSGDEFVFLCENLADHGDAQLLVARTAAAFEVPFEVSGVQLTLAASVGMAFAGPGETIADGLLVEADAAMHRAKHAGHWGRQLPGRRGATAVDDRGLEAQLWAALADEEFDVVYQPLVRSGDGLIVGVEALLRWTDVTRGAVPPSTVVTVAERSDLINQVGAWVLQRSCEDHRRWRTTHRDVTVDLAVNVSVRQLLTPGFVDTVASVLEATATAPGAVILEITESVLMNDTGRAQRVLNELRATGVRIALDDFGTGFSSLSYLRQLPIDIVKIDRSFVADIGGPDGGGELLAAVTELAHTLRLPVTAEGVETRHQRDEVAAIGCELAQGFFYAHPMSATAFGELLGHNGDAGHLPTDTSTPALAALVSSTANGGHRQG